MNEEKIMNVALMYSDYVKKPYDEQVDAGDILWTAGSELLSIDKKKLSNEYALQRSYLLNRIACDLLRHRQMTGVFEKFDMGGMEDYCYLAFDLAYEYCQRQPDRRLLPFLANVLYYENFKEDKVKLVKLQEMYKHCVNIENKYLEKLLVSDSPWYVVDPGAF